MSVFDLFVRRQIAAKSMRARVFALCVFGESHYRLRWWMRFLRPGFRHCAVAWETPGGWLVLNRCFGLLVVDLWAREYEPQEIVKMLCGEQGIGVWVDRYVDASQFRMWWWPDTCVAVIGQALGLRIPALTPYGLFRRLVRDGGMLDF